MKCPRGIYLRTSVLVVTVPGELTEADARLPRKEANAVCKQYGEGGGNAFT